MFNVLKTQSSIRNNLIIRNNAYITSRLSFKWLNYSRVNTFSTHNNPLCASEVGSISPEVGSISSEVRSISTDSPLHHGKFYFDNIYPIKIGSFDIRHRFVRSNRSILEYKIKSGKWIPQESTMPYEFKVESIEPRKKEGGMFVNFSFRADPKLKESALEEIENHIKEHLTENKLVPWFNFQPNKAYIVEGEPFIEDLVQRYPASRLRVEFKGPDIQIESLFYTFRKYGLIRDITLQESAKEPPRFAMIIYSSMRSAASARNCVHGKIINSTKLNIFYEQPLKSNLIYNWMVAHPRISVPLIAAIVAGVSYIIFDPIRVFFIESKITQRFNPQEYRIYQWLKRQAFERILYWNKLSYDPLADISTWKEREQEEQKLRNWLKEPPETFIILMGPPGTGKSRFIEKVTQDKKNKIVIKCDEILNSHTENEFILKLAKQVGYFPVFSIFISMSNLIDGLASAMIGNKTLGFTSSSDSEIKKILDALAIALHDLAPPNSVTRKHQKKSNKSAEPQFIESYDPADIPIVVIDSFMTKDTTERDEIWNHLAKLASLLVDNGVAHVVFVSSNVGIVKSLSKVFPNRTFNYCNLTDAPTERAVNLVNMNVDGYNIEELEEQVKILGGRVTDLRVFINKIRSGQTPQDALNDLITKANIEIRKIGFGDDTDDAKTIPWKGIQFWKVMKELVQNDHVSYDAIKFSPFFNGDDTAIRAMEEAELITILQLSGRPDQIQPGKPLYKAAFAQIRSDTLFAAIMELQTAQFMLSFETAKITKCEEELEKLGHLFVKQEGKWLLGGGHVPASVDERVKFLLARMQKHHSSAEKWQTEVDRLKKAVISGSV
ncbi:RNA12 protein [Gigaspora rosea]|uniref:Mitochondrial escape protein 2 n=1 Tax=Gigaspora rosea TaxID=44941 RepID=A0A397TZP4_9GLOM|nr:RNA12 protein [Gigaspora rosea]